MKTRLLGALVGLAISFALPTFAQLVAWVGFKRGNHHPKEGRGPFNQDADYHSHPFG